MKIWIQQDYESGEYYILDDGRFDGYGPIEISNELYERIMEHDREHAVIQDILDTLRYEWENPYD